MQRKHLESQLSEIYSWLFLVSELTLNGDKFDWETMNTREIKLLFNVAARTFLGPNDYGTRIQIKCHQKIEQISQTLDAEKCVNWEFMDSFGIKSVGLSVVHKFYQSVNWRGIGLRLVNERY